jgi:hypothetical protein
VNLRERAADADVTIEQYCRWYSEDPTIESCKRFWAELLASAVVDATAPGRTADAKIYRANALSWIYAAEDCRTGVVWVCDLIGADYEWVLDRLDRKLTAVAKMRAAFYPPRAA